MLSIKEYIKESKRRASDPKYVVLQKYHVNINKFEKECSDYFMDAEIGDKDATYKVAICKFRGICTSESFEEGINWLIKAAKLESTQAMLDLAFFYKKGIGVKQDYKTMKYWLDRAINVGCEEAIVQYAECLFRGQGFEEDKEVAKSLLNELIEKDNSSAMLTYSLLFEDEDDELMKRAAELGNREAIKYLGLIDAVISKFSGVEENEIDLRKRLVYLIEQNDLWSISMLGKQLIDNPVYPNDYEQGIKFLEYAAKHGILSAECYLYDELHKDDIDENE